MKLATIATLSLLAGSNLLAESKPATITSTTPTQAKASNYIEAYYYKPGYVISPYKPYNVLDVKHLKPGNLAYDPFTAPKDPTTGKTMISSAKIFRVPAPKPKPAPATAPSS